MSEGSLENDLKGGTYSDEPTETPKLSPPLRFMEYYSEIQLTI